MKSFGLQRTLHLKPQRISLVMPLFRGFSAFLLLSSLVCSPAALDAESHSRGIEEELARVDRPELIAWEASPGRRPRAEVSALGVPLKPVLGAPTATHEGNE
jgi:hypothetical protein